MADEGKYIKSVLRISFSLLLCISGTWLHSFAQTGQIAIPRVTQMPNLPAPYLMRNWNDVAIKYDALIFSTSAAGEYLPLIHSKSTGTNFHGLEPILLDTYVGSVYPGNQAEAINIIPALIGATLVGVDKSSQAGTNWVVKSKD